MYDSWSNEQLLAELRQRNTFKIVYNVNGRTREELINDARDYRELRVDQLKDVLRRSKFTVSGNKPDLLKRLTDNEDKLLPPAVPSGGTLQPASQQGTLQPASQQGALQTASQQGALQTASQQGAQFTAPIKLVPTALGAKPPAARSLTLAFQAQGPATTSTLVSLQAQPQKHGEFAEYYRTMTTKIGDLTSRLFPDAPSNMSAGALLMMHLYSDISPQMSVEEFGEYLHEEMPVLAEDPLRKLVDSMNRAGFLRSSRGFNTESEVMEAFHDVEFDEIYKIFDTCLASPVWDTKYSSISKTLFMLWFEGYIGVEDVRNFYTET